MRKDYWTSSKSSCLAEPVTPPPVMTEQGQSTTTKNIILVEIQQSRWGLLLDALVWSQKHQVKSKALKQFWIASHNKDANHMDRVLPLGARCKTHVDACWPHHQKYVSDFENWQSTLVEPRESTPGTNYLEIVQHKLALTCSKQLSRITKANHCNANASLGSTRNASKMLNKSPIFETCSEEVYAISEDNGSNKEVDKPKNTVPQNLTPVTIMVVDTISSFRSRTLLRVLLDSGSTTTLIRKNAYLGTIIHIRSPKLGKWIP